MRSASTLQHIKLIHDTKFQIFLSILEFVLSPVLSCALNLIHVVSKKLTVYHAVINKISSCNKQWNISLSLRVLFAFIRSLDLCKSFLYPIHMSNEVKLIVCSKCLDTLVCLISNSNKEIPPLHFFTLLFRLLKKMGLLEKESAGTKTRVFSNRVTPLQNDQV